MVQQPYVWYNSTTEKRKKINKKLTLKQKAPSTELRVLTATKHTMSQQNIIFIQAIQSKNVINSLQKYIIKITKYKY